MPVAVIVAKGLIGVVAGFDGHYREGMFASGKRALGLCIKRSILSRDRVIVFASVRPQDELGIQSVIRGSPARSNRLRNRKFMRA